MENDRLGLLDNHGIVMQYVEKPVNSKIVVKLLPVILYNKISKYLKKLTYINKS